MSRDIDEAADVCVTCGEGFPCACVDSADLDALTGTISALRARVAQLEAALQAIYSTPAFPSRDIAERALRAVGALDEYKPRSAEELRAALAGGGSDG